MGGSQLGTRADEYLCRLSENERSEIIRRAAFRSGRSACFMTSAIIASMRHDKPLLERLGRIGVIVASAPLHVPVAWDFGRRQLAEGAHLIDPIKFPHSIPSSVAVSVASAFECHAFALADGSGAHAFFQALLRAISFMTADHCDAVLVCAACDSAYPNNEASASIGLELVDFVACFLLSWDLGDKCIDRVFYDCSKEDALRSALTVADVDVGLLGASAAYNLLGCSLQRDWPREAVGLGIEASNRVIGVGFVPWSTT